MAKNIFQTRFTELLGIKYPIVQGAMYWVSNAELVSAVSNAGCLGVLSGLTFESPDGLDAEIKKTRKLTSSPFGVNVTILPTLHPVNYDSYLDCIIDNGVKIVETAGRNPEPYMAKLKAAGVKVIHKCTAVRFAQKAESIGVSVISIDGFECGGHPGEEDVTSLVLTPTTADAVKIPVISSGGFADGRGLVAALSLGAEGMNMGTRFMATVESPVHARVKEWLVRATEKDTLMVLRSLRNSLRALKNPTTEKVAELERKGTTIEELAPLISGKRGVQMEQTGNIDDGVLSAGQSVGLIHDIPTVKELVDRIIKQAEEIIEKRLAKLVLT